ncbi:MAG TPA: NAD(P)/FAD-dependent oxidoreductase [Thermoanaerobaculia bacterium]|jgi:flavin-dependent dehydrogenase|nr:NAD(P)/FAD-dependent oxidoreductase [Thermoanaerobaculia bacterium]
MRESYDAIVIGGGPGGSTVATMLARAGRNVLLLEREKFPRFHVGESLLPFNVPLFDRLGVAGKIHAAGFQKKHGAFFWNEATGGVRPVDFARGVDDRHPMAFHVKRAEFDDLLLRHAEESGAQVREETAVEEVLFEGERAVGVIARSRTGAEDIRARVVVDASGQTALLSRQLGTRKLDPKLKRAGLFAHYEGIRWPEGQRPGDILLPIDREVWYWIIPFSDGTCSVGEVFEPSLAASLPLPPGEGRGEGAAARTEALFDLLLARSPRMQEFIAGARRTSRVVGISDYSTSSARASGEGWALVGDAATFLDPVFSTGVFLAMAMGERAAYRIDRALTKRGSVGARDLAPYAKEASRLVGRFRRFVYAFYDPVFFEAFCSHEPFDRMRAAVTTVLSGGVERIPIGARIWIELVFLSVAFDRFRRRLGLGAKPEQAAA